MRYIYLFARTTVLALFFATILGSAAHAESVTVRDIVALKDRYSAENEPGNTNGDPYARARALTIKSPLFTNGEHTIYRSSTSTNNDVSLKCGSNSQLFAQLMTDEGTWSSLDQNKRPDSVRFGLYLSANNASEIVSENCPNLIDGIAAGMEGKAQLPEKATQETQTDLDYALHMGAGNRMASTDSLDRFKNDPATFVNWCTTSSRGVACSDEKWKELLGICSVRARSQAADAARYSRPAPSEDAMKDSRQQLFGTCLSQQLYNNNSQAGAITNALKRSGDVDPITAAIAGSQAKASKAKEMLESLQSKLGDPTNSAGKEEAKSTCGTEVTGIGWIMCPVTNAGIMFADTVWSIFEAMLVTNPLRETGGEDRGAYYSTWQNIRNIANVLFIIAFLLVVFSQISSMGISNYGIKKMLPRMIIAAIAINLSFIIVQIAVDVANILGKTIMDLMLSSVEVEPNWGGLLQDILALGATGTLAFLGATFTVSSGLAMPMLIFLALLLIPAVVGLIAGFLTLAIRSALIPILAIFAPLAFVAFIFPNGRSLFDKWQKTFTSLLLLYPLSAVYFGSLKFTAALMINTNGIIERLVGHTLLFAGCFIVLGIALKGNAVTGKVFGSIQKGLNKVATPAQKFGLGVAGGMMALKFAQFKNRDFGTAPTRRKFDPRRVTDKLTTSGIGRTLQKFDDSQVTRKRATDFAKEVATENYEDRLLEGYDPNNTGTISKMALDAAGGDRGKAKIMLDRLQATRKAENLKKSLSTLQAEFAREKALGNKTDTFLKNRALHASSDSDRDAALHMAAQMGRSIVIRDIQSDPSYATSPSLQTATQEAISANTSSLIGKAPDLVKGDGPAFTSVTGEQLAGFSEDTIKSYMTHIENQISAGDHSAAQSLLGAVEDITRTPTIQAKFDGRSGRELLSRVTASTVLSSNPDVAAAARAIGPDGKIR